MIYISDAAMNVMIKTHSKAAVYKFARVFWNLVRSTSKNDVAYRALTDSKKINYWHSNNEYKQFCADFAIVVRFMITDGLYSKRAFKYLLTHLYNEEEPPMADRKKGYALDKYCRDGAYYYKYLHKFSMSGTREVSSEELSEVYESTYETLTQENEEFHTKYMDTEKASKMRRERQRGERLREALIAVREGRRTMPERAEGELIHRSCDQIARRNMDEVIAQIESTAVPVVAPACEGEGQNKTNKIDDKAKPTVRIVETVDHRRMDEVPSHLIVDDAMSYGLSQQTAG